MARFFIDRPVFAMVIAIVIVLLGAVAIPNLPIASYPEVVPPQVTVTANYLGGSAQDLEKTVAQPIEEQLVGLDGLLYYASNSANNGVMTITLTFKLGTNPDIAAVQTQDRVSIALPRLPPEVQQQGVVVKKVSTAFLMAIVLDSKDGRYDTGFLTNYAQLHLVNQLGSLPGVGDSRLGSSLVYSMRIWVNPDKMTKLGVTATDIRDAIAAQNKQNPAGQVGIAPAPAGTDFQYTVNAPGRLTDPEQFGNIVIRALPDASLLRIKDVARVELGSLNYNGFSRMSGRPSGNVFLFLSPGANAVDTANQVKKQMQAISASLPAGIEYQIPYDSTIFVRAAIADVAQTLLEAVGLVLLVVFLFLQNWRATLIPLLTVPVAVVGTFAVFPLLGFSINITTMFGLVLAIGIVVDDAIVVVEAVQRHIDEGMAPRQATIQAMNEVSAPVVAIAFILAAVFIPVAFLGGLSGQIYRQFALTIAFSVLLSAFNALSLSPALSALLLKPSTGSKSLMERAFAGFNHGFAWTTNRYLGAVRVLIRRSALALVCLAVFWVSAGVLFKKLPTGFLPEEDQGAFFISVRLPDGASMQRTDATSQKIEKIVMGLPGVERYFVNGGNDNATGTQGSNTASIIAEFKPWDERKSPDEQLGAIIRTAQRRFADVPEAFTFPFGLPPILGLASTGGFQFVLEDQSGGDIDALARTADEMLKAARARPELVNVISNFHPDVPALKLNMDLEKLQTMGVPVAEAYNGLQTFLGGLYVNDFNLYGHTWQVIVQAEPEFRDERRDVDRYYVRSATTGDMVPLSTVASIVPTSGPEVIFRYNRFRAVTIFGSPAPGYSSGEAVKVMEDVAAKNMPAGYGYEWTGTTYQQKQAEGHEGFIFGLACLLVFLFLAALYESWSVPLAVLFALPLGIFGALLAVYLRGYPYDIYTQIGIVTLIGLSAKNAILIVEFARTSHEEHGMSILDSAMEAARLRLRPILMTSFAFILGVLPLFLATGASSASRRSLGTAVFGGMLAATLLAVLIVPVLYVVVETLVERWSKKGTKTASQPEPVAELVR
jgi:hydrophobe/amphiphile efflux-1 (HAE1) family protein